LEVNREVGSVGRVFEKPKAIYPSFYVGILPSPVVKEMSSRGFASGGSASYYHL
jgi:hypothetical protein